VPQFLRWLGEWYEEFSKKRQELLGDIQKSCKTKTSTDKCDDNNECQNACKKYGDWLKPKGNEWREQKSKYAKDHNNANEYYEDEEFLTATKGHTTAIEYLKNKCKNSSDWKYDKTNVEDMDQIVRKKDDEYRTNYEPLCTRCRMKDIQDTIKQIKDKKYTTTLQNPESKLIVENICDDNKNVHSTKANNKEEITIPIEPDDSDRKKNKE
ncbi:putative EMP1-like protein, partial [Plasmodium gaboni]